MGMAGRVEYEIIWFGSRGAVVERGGFQEVLDLASDRMDDGTPFTIRAHRPPDAEWVEYRLKDGGTMWGPKHAAFDFFPNVEAPTGRTRLVAFGPIEEAPDGP